jgi:single-strand DNA-binding protein
MNTLVVIGNLTRDPESRNTNTGTVIANLGIAVNERFNADKEHCNFFDVTAFGKTAEFCSNYLKKGYKIAIKGRLKQEQWTDKQTGQNRSKVIIIAESVDNLTPRDNSAKPQTTTPIPPPPPPLPPMQEALPVQAPTTDESIYDIPF